MVKDQFTYMLYQSYQLNHIVGYDMRGDKHWGDMTA
jgi:hypothetical protein